MGDFMKVLAIAASGAAFFLGFLAGRASLAQKLTLLDGRDIERIARAAARDEARLTVRDALLEARYREEKERQDKEHMGKVFNDIANGN